MVRKVVDEKPITMGQVYEFLMEREKDGINYIQRITADYAAKISKGAVFSEENIKKIQEQFNLTRLEVVQLINLDPKTEIDVKVVIGDKLSKDEIEQLLELYAKIRDSVKPIKEEKAEEEYVYVEEDDFDDFDDFDDL